MKMSEKHKSTSPSAMQVKNQRNTITVEEILDIICQLQKGNDLLTYAIMLDLFIVAHIQFTIMLMELKKMLSQELKCLFV
jgi:hypothetical protein